MVVEWTARWVGETAGRSRESGELSPERLPAELSGRRRSDWSVGSRERKAALASTAEGSTASESGVDASGDRSADPLPDAPAGDERRDAVADGHGGDARRGFARAWSHVANEST